MNKTILITRTSSGPVRLDQHFAEQGWNVAAMRSLNVMRSYVGFDGQAKGFSNGGG